MHILNKITVFSTIFACFCLFLPVLGHSQSANNDQFATAKITPLEGAILKTSAATVHLWGIKTPASDASNDLKARNILDQMIGSAVVRCQIRGKNSRYVYAQCVNTSEQDLALELLKQGVAYVDRSVLYAQPQLLSAYTEAENYAARLKKGLWYDSSAAATSFLDFDNLRPDMKKNLFTILTIIGVGPLFGLLIVALIMFMGFGRLIRMQKSQMAKTSKDEKELKEREKFVLASSLEGEIQANKSKVEAFVTIYKELLKDIRNPNKTPKYQQTGDIIHEKPALMRMVYDANIDKIALLGPNVAGLLSKIYSEVEVSPKYQTIEPDVPLKDAEAIVEHIVVSAEKFLPSMDKVLSGLSVIIRNK